MTRARSQSGATLVIALAMLVFMLMLGTGASRLLMLDQHAGSHWRGQVAARLAAQAALDDALDDLRRDRQPFPADIGCAAGTGLCVAAPEPAAMPPAILIANSVAYGSLSNRQPPSPGEDGVAAPRYQIALVTPAPGMPPIWYRISAIGFGPGGARAMLQAVVERRQAGEPEGFIPRAWRELPPAAPRVPR